MGGPLRVGDGGGERATFARGRWTLRLGGCVLRGGCGRARTANQRMSGGGGWVGVEGRDGGWEGKGALSGREDCGCEDQAAALPPTR